MLRNFFIIGWRNILKNGMYSVINIAGLSFGLVVAMLIGLWIFNELNYNRSFKNYDRLAQLYHHVSFGDEVMTINDVPAPIGEELKSNFDEFEDVSVTSWPGEHIIACNGTKLSETVLFVESGFLNMFSVKLLQGPDNPLAGAHSVIISKALSSVMFEDDPIGEVIKLDDQNLLTVAGVFDDFPASSQFAEVKIMLPMRYYFSRNGSDRAKQHNWEDWSFQCFLLLKDNVQLNDTEAKIKNFLFERSSEDGKAINPEGMLFPMKKWHLFASFEDGVNTGGQIRFVWMFGTTGIFVLLLACINFINLSTVGSEKRSREVGVRKAMGSTRTQLVLQFLSESLLVVLFSYFAGLALAVLSFPWFDELAGKRVSVPWTDPRFISMSLIFILITGLLAGVYPALYLSAFDAVKVLKGSYKAGRFSALPRKVLVIMQFTTSIVLIIGTAIVFRQIQYAKDRPVGFDREGILHLAIRTERLEKADYNSLRNELLATGVVENMALSDFPITGSMSGDASITWEGKDPASVPLVAMNSCSHDFPKTNGFRFVQGRDFSRDLSSDSSAVIINEMAAKLISEKNVIGKKITFGQGQEREIIGVIKDQVRWTPFEKQSPHLYYIDYSAAGSLTIRLDRHAEVHEALPRIETVIKRFDARAPFEYKFLDDDYERQFKGEERIGKLAAIFSLLAIFISCIGIFGLATFTARQRTKEIGIRKVLGASVFSVWKMLSNDFIKLVIIAILPATPLAYYLATRWLQQYDYRVEISWTVFVSTGVLAVMITLLTVSYQAFKAALMDPTQSLKAE